jgi:hypothetical protein
MLEVLETVLEHAEGKGWRSDLVAELVRTTIAKAKGRKFKDEHHE